MSFYHLPNPWDPGYAIPKYVMGEPPERGTFTTQWLPRGTIQTLIPDFLAKPGQKLLGRDDAGLEGLGSLGGCSLEGNSLRGTSLSGSSLAGDSLGARVYQLEPLGAGPANFSSYGLKAARAMIANVKRLPPTMRAGAMKAAMARIDPTLQSRAETHALAAKARGVPAGKALEHGIATAMTQGVLGELTRAGRSRRAPQPNSLLGLGCNHAQSALGAIMATKTTVANYYPPPAGFTWDPSINALRRLVVGEIPMQCPAPCAVDTRDHPTGDQVSTGPTAAERAEALKRQYIQIGPNDMVMFPADTKDGASINLHSPAALSPEWKAFLHGAWTTKTVGGAEMETLTPKNADTFQTFGGQAWLDALGIRIGQVANNRRMNGSDFSFVFKHPVFNEDWGMIAALGVPIGDSLDNYPDAAHPYALYIRVRKVPEKNWFTRLISTVVDVVESVVDAVASLTCNLVKSPGAVQGAAKANPAAAAGVVIAASAMCPTPPQVPFPPSSSSSWLPLLFVAGGGIALIAIIKSRQ